MVPSPSLALLGFQIFTNRSQSENPLARPRVFFSPDARNFKLQLQMLVKTAVGRGP